MSSDAPPTHPGLPHVDERLAVPETCYEVHDGEPAYVHPADECRGMRLATILAIVEAHVGREFDVAYKMLTRLTEVDDKASDVSVFPCRRDPETGRRQIEQLAFDVVHTEDIERVGIKAAQLMARGARRVFAIDIDRSCALEWSATLGTWSVLDPTGRIDDPALAVPVSIDDLLHATCIDDVVARALIAKRNPVIEAARIEAYAKSYAEGFVKSFARRRAERHAKLFTKPSA